jgi:protein disulfide-isomerase A1
VSEPIRAEDIDKPLKKIVGANFNQWVLENPKDVFLTFIGPASPYCRFLLPVLNETAHLLQDVATLDLAFIDGVVNDLPEYLPDISTYPTSYLWPSGRKDAPVKYSGPRKVDKVLDFLTGSVTTAFELPEYNLTEIEGRIRLVLHPPKNATQPPATE